MHATAFEIYLITENAFARLNSELAVIEQRTLPLSNSIPALSDNTFVRLTTNDQNRQVIEFRLARNGDETFRVLVDTLPAPAGNSLEIETYANSIGAFSTDGTRFLMAAKALPARYYSLFLFDIQQNLQHNAFVSVKMIKRIDLADLDANADGVVKSIRFVNGNFYVATQQGGWRITPAGEAVKKFSQWKEDCFSWLGDIYMTGVVDFDLDKSIDNGLSWERVNIGSALRHVTVADTMVFTQEVPGKPFALMPKDFKQAKAIAYPDSIDLAASLFYGMVYFQGRYYVSIDRNIYAATAISAK